MTISILKSKRIPKKGGMQRDMDNIHLFRNLYPDYYPYDTFKKKHSGYLFFKAPQISAELHELYELHKFLDVKRHLHPRRSQDVTSPAGLWSTHQNQMAA